MPSCVQRLSRGRQHSAIRISCGLEHPVDPRSGVRHPRPRRDWRRRSGFAPPPSHGLPLPGQSCGPPRPLTAGGGCGGGCRGGRGAAGMRSWRRLCGCAHAAFGRCPAVVAPVSGSARRARGAAHGGRAAGIQDEIILRSRSRAPPRPSAATATPSRCPGTRAARTSSCRRC